VRDGWVLNGEKTWISNGGIADVYCVFARTGEAPGARGLSAFLCRPTRRGCEVVRAAGGDRAASAGAAALRRPAAAGIGADRRPGEGFKIAMSVLDVFRSTVGAAALGFARRALDETLAGA
jgi:acyl-CoA dehydrogenase